jgi:protein-tyrosine phosphatase
MRIEHRGYERPPLDVTDQDIFQADHVVAVKEAEHRPLLTRRFPTHVQRVEFWQVHDIDCGLPCQAFPHLETRSSG